MYVAGPWEIFDGNSWEQPCSQGLHTLIYCALRDGLFELKSDERHKTVLKNGMCRRRAWLFSQKLLSVVTPRTTDILMPWCCNRVEQCCIETYRAEKCRRPMVDPRTAYFDIMIVFMSDTLSWKLQTMLKSTNICAEKHKRLCWKAPINVLKSTNACAEKHKHLCWKAQTLVLKSIKHVCWKARTLVLKSIKHLCWKA